MRIAAILLLTLAALPAFAKWESCPSSCSPPATATALSRLPLYAGPVKFGGDAKGGMWIWLKTAAVTCTPTQQSERSDKFACAAPIGAEMFRTPRVRNVADKLTGAVLMDRGRTSARQPEWCPLRLPDSAYGADERRQCAAVAAEMGEVRGPD